jgi:membrane protein
MLELLKRHAERLLWSPRLEERGDIGHRLLRLLRFPYALVRDALEGQLTLRAMSLVYTTLLSIVPFIALAFSVLKGFGVHWEVEPLLRNVLSPIGERGGEVAAGIIAFVDKVRVDVLGAVGLVFLIVTVLSLIQKVEEACNYVWQVDRARSLGRRVSEYLSILLVGPVLMVAALALIATISSSALMNRVAAIDPFGTTLLLLGELGPFLLVIATFSFIYGFVPNTRVRIPAALAGGISAGVLWTITGKLFASFVAASTKYTAISSGFAIGIVALIWVYLSWLILLLGADVAFYYQNRLMLRSGRTPRELDNVQRERLALAIMYLVAADFAHGESRWTTSALCARFATPRRSLDGVLNALRDAGLLTESDDGRVLPARDLGTISLCNVLEAVRRAAADPRPVGLPRVDGVTNDVDAGIRNALGERTLRDLVEAPPDDRPSGPRA